jgi:arylsulfatase A-like enzyme
MKRINLLKCLVLFVCVPLSIVCHGQKRLSKERPNIIFIFTDQQNSSMMSCAGNKWLKTPGMDYIAENGIRFTRAYTTNPVCSPARVSLITGRFPGAFHDKNGNQVRENEGAVNIPQVSEEVKITTISAFLKNAGYELFYGGKQHLPPSLRPEVLGFNYFCSDEREKLADETAKLIKEKHENPYFMMVSLIEPHDICFMPIRDFAISESVKKFIIKSTVECAALDKAMQMPAGVTDQDFIEKYCPPLPPNHEPQKDEPKAIKYLIDAAAGLPNSDFIRLARDKYSDKDWRIHRWAYCRLVELADKRVQTILDAVKSSGQEENTLIIFSSDHGEMDGAHRLLHKTALYEESANIPFMAMWKGHIIGGQIDNDHLISSGLDFLPTVCDYAGIKGTSDPRGRSLRPLFEGKRVDWRNTLGVESEIGRMVVSKDKLKYIKYDAVGVEEQLFDLNQDPGEMNPVTNDPKYKESLVNICEAFQKWFPGY